MLLRQVIVGALLVAVLIILVRTVLGTPAVRRIAESFANGSGGGANSLLNTSTECPSGSQIYMYEGAAYCCNGRLNTDADTIGATCRPMLGQQSGRFVFCTLGPTADGVANCLELRTGLLAAEQEKYCPPQMPNFAQATVARDDPGRCCAGPANSAQTACADPSGPSCAVSADPNEFKSPQSCQYLKAVAAAGPCPTGYTPLQTQGAGALAGLTLYGCTDMGQNCYPAGALARLKELGYDTTGLTACSSSAPS